MRVPLLLPAGKRRLRAGPAASLLWLLSLLVAGFVAGAKGADDNAASTSFAPVQAALEKAEGNLNAEVRAAYLDWCEQTVLKKLSDAGVSIPADCLAEVRADPALRDAMFAAIDPPDPGILQNYARLRAALGAPFTAKYRALVVADAVATRTNGARIRPDPDLGGEAHPVRPGNPAEDGPDPLVQGIAGYMKQTGVSSLYLFQNEQERQKLEGYLEYHKIDAGLKPGLERVRERRPG